MDKFAKHYRATFILITVSVSYYCVITWYIMNRWKCLIFFWKRINFFCGFNKLKRLTKLSSKLQSCCSQRYCMVMSWGEDTHLLGIRTLSEVIIPGKNTFYSGILNKTNYTASTSAEVLAIFQNILLWRWGKIIEF